MSIELPSYVVDVFYFVGLPWPGVDEDELRAWGQDLRDFAEEITAISELSNGAVSELAGSGESVFLTTLAQQWEHHHGQFMALRGPMNAFADALDVAATAIEAQKVVVIGAAVALAAEIVATQAEALVTFGLAEAEVPLEVAATKLIIKFALQELENELLGALINDASETISDHISGTVGNLLMGGVGVAGEAWSLKADTKGIQNLAATIRTHRSRTETASSEAHRRTANRKLETRSPGGKWHVVQVLEAALLSIAGDLFKKLPGTMAQIMQKTERELTEAAERLEQLDGRLAAEVPTGKSAGGGGGGGKPPKTPSAGGAAAGGSEPTGGGGGPRRKRPKMPPKDTPEGKAARWERYQRDVAAGKRKKPLDYDAWSSKYDVAIYQAERADAAVDDYLRRSGRTKENGWVKGKNPIVLGDRKRVLDLVNIKRSEGIEYKSGAVPNDAKTNTQIDHDTVLIKQGWNIKWVFRVDPPQWLRDRLEAGKIPWEMDDGGTPGE